MANRFTISVEPIEPSGAMLTIAELPGLLIFGDTTRNALLRAREAIAFQLRDFPEPTEYCPPSLSCQGELVYAARPRGALSAAGFLDHRSAALGDDDSAC